MRICIIVPIPNFEMHIFRKPSIECNLFDRVRNSTLNTRERTPETSGFQQQSFTKRTNC